jgi:predicted RNA-binding Zn-ribbon protein involved in translation (DUF1610 family)
MYECPNCAGNLKFNIARQQLHCEYCDTQVDPYSFHKEKDAGEEPPGEYEATVFTCPQCGGEIVSEDTTAATFCSFCCHFRQPHQQKTVSGIYHPFYQNEGGLQSRLWKNAETGYFCAERIEG